MPYGNKPKSMGLKKLAQANPDKLKYVGPAKYAPKKMGCSGGGPNMYKMGSKEKNTPMNFSDKAMMYMKNMPAMYGKPKMDGDPVKEKKLTERVKKETATSTDAGKMREATKKLKEGGYLNRTSHNAWTHKPATAKEEVQRHNREYIKRFGAGAWQVQKAESMLKEVKEQGPASNMKKDVVAWQQKLAKMKQHVANAKKNKKANNTKSVDSKYVGPAKYAPKKAKKTSKNKK